jgi:pimeloyl-ACP methyl ester carboxylesterase
MDIDGADRRVLLPKVTQIGLRGGNHGNSERKVERGVVERRFDMQVDAETVPGIRWSPEGATVPRPTILIGHGGTQHKRVPNVLGLARRFVRHLGYCAVALDAPGHGDRITDHAKAERRRQAIQARIAAGPESAGVAVGPEEAREWVERTTKGIAEWHALLDSLDAEGEGPRYGYWGVSMGTAIGLPFVAAEPRVSAAVLGLAGLGSRPGADRFERAARGLTVPVLLVLQWNDELVGQTSGLALFDAIGSTEKTLHVNRGGHVQIPLFERDAYEAFFLRHLGPAVEPE